MKNQFILALPVLLYILVRVVEVSHTQAYHALPDVIATGVFVVLGILIAKNTKDKENSDEH